MANCGAIPQQPHIPLPFLRWDATDVHLGLFGPSPISNQSHHVHTRLSLFNFKDDNYGIYSPDTDTSNYIQVVTYHRKKMTGGVSSFQALYHLESQIDFGRMLQWRLNFVTLDEAQVDMRHGFKVVHD